MVCGEYDFEWGEMNGARRPIHSRQPDSGQWSFLASKQENSQAAVLRHV
jgi:hypothetical protein